MNSLTATTTRSATAAPTTITITRANGKTNRIQYNHHKLCSRHLQLHSTQRLANARKIYPNCREIIILVGLFFPALLFFVFLLAPSAVSSSSFLFSRPFVLRRPTRAYQTREPNHRKPVIYVFFFMPYILFFLSFFYRASLAF